jgi:hypothetical protein
MLNPTSFLAGYVLLLGAIGPTESAEKAQEGTCANVMSNSCPSASDSLPCIYSNCYKLSCGGGSAGTTYTIYCSPYPG